MQSYISILTPFIALFFSVACVVIGLMCVWRVQKRLKTFMVLLTISMAVMAVRKGLATIGFNQGAEWLNIVQDFDVVMTFFILLAFIEMFHIVRLLDREE